MTQLKRGWAWNAEETNVCEVVYFPVKTRGKRRNQQYVHRDKPESPKQDRGWNTHQVFASRQHAIDALVAYHRQKVQAARKAYETVMGKQEAMRRELFT